MALSMGLLGGAGFVAPVAVPAFDLLETQVLTGNQSSVNFTGLIAKYASEYQHLQLRSAVRSNRGSTVDSVGLRFNGASSGYAFHVLRGLNTTRTSYNSLSESSLQDNTICGNNGAANNFGAAVTDILDPFSSDKMTTTRCLDGWMDPGENIIAFHSGVYLTTTPVDSINLVSRAGASFVAGSRFSIYGVRGGA